MKKLLIIAIVAASFAQDASAMVFKKTKDGRYLPAFLSKFNLQKDQNASEAQGFSLNALEGLEGDARKEAIKVQCDAFKKNSENLGMWSKPEEVEERKIEKIYNCFFQKKQRQDFARNLFDESIVLSCNNDYDSLFMSNAKISDNIDQLQDNEWKQWQIRSDNRIMGIAIDYQEKEKKQSESIDSTKACIVYDQSPYYKITIEDFSNNIGWGNVLENNIYHEALQSLQVTKEVIKRDLYDFDLANQSYFQKLWNYRARQRTYKTLELVQNEIESFKKLENRDAFTRSAMPRSMFEQIKKDRE